jgi:integrase
MTRRGHGEGSVYFDEHSGRWTASVELPTVQGKRARRKVTGKSRAEVKLRLKALRADLDNGADLVAGRMTVAALLTEWQRDALHQRHPSVNTVENVRWVVDGHLVPSLGTKRIDELRVEHVERMLRQMTDRGMARNSAVRIRGVLQQALRWAQRRGYIVRNAAELAEIPGDARRPKEGRALTLGEASALLAATNGTRLEALWKASLCLGLRPGEVSGLLWIDVDLDTDVLHVRRSMKWRGDQLLGLDEVKTGNMGRGRRSLVMPPLLSDAFRRHRVANAAERLAAGPAWPSEWSDLVFVSQAGTPLNPRNLRRDLRSLATKAGIGHVTRYDLRHSAATLLAAQGLRIEEIADVLGHETLRMSRAVYVHAQGRPLDAAATAMQALG